MSGAHQHIHPRQSTCRAWPSGCWVTRTLSALSWVFPFSNESTGKSVTKSNPYSKGMICPIFWRDVIKRVDTIFQIWDEVRGHPERIILSFYHVVTEDWTNITFTVEPSHRPLQTFHAHISPGDWKDSNLWEEFESDWSFILLGCWIKSLLEMTSSWASLCQEAFNHFFSLLSFWSDSNFFIIPSHWIVFL